MWVLHRGKYNSYPPPKEHFSLLHTHRSFKFAASVVIGILHAWRRHCLNHFKNDQIWSILQQKTKPIVFEFDPLFLILMVTCLAAHTVYATIIWCHDGDVSENKQWIRVLLIVIIIHSKYFPDSDWLKEHVWFTITSYCWPNWDEFCV